MLKNKQCSNVAQGQQYNISTDLTFSFAFYPRDGKVARLGSGDREGTSKFSLAYYKHFVSSF